MWRIIGFFFKGLWIFLMLSALIGIHILDELSLWKKMISSIVIIIAIIVMTLTWFNNNKDI